jgi:hypothetical protein
LKTLTEDIEIIQKPQIAISTPSLVLKCFILKCQKPGNDRLLINLNPAVLLWLEKLQPAVNVSYAHKHGFLTPEYIYIYLKKYAEK